MFLSLISRLEIKCIKVRNCSQNFSPSFTVWENLLNLCVLLLFSRNHELESVKGVLTESTSGTFHDQ